MDGTCPSPIAQSVERTAVNREVCGSNPHGRVCPAQAKPGAGREKFCPAQAGKNWARRRRGKIGPGAGGEKLARRRRSPPQRVQPLSASVMPAARVESFGF